jgi:hypothetical protein
VFGFHGKPYCRYEKIDIGVVQRYLCPFMGVQIHTRNIRRIMSAKPQ